MHKKWEEAILRLLEVQTISKLCKSRRLIISGMSGSGKTTLGKALEKKGFRKIPNVVTRPQRYGEREGENIFIDEKTFLDWRRWGRFAIIRQTNGVWHGILTEHLDFVRKSRRRVYFDKSIPSARRLIKFLPGLKFSLIYLLPPSFDVLYKRLIRREEKNGLKREEIYKRLAEEVSELDEDAQLSYVYMVNDRISRIIQLIFRNL